MLFAVMRNVLLERLETIGRIRSRTLRSMQGSVYICLRKFKDLPLWRQYKISRNLKVLCSEISLSS